MYHSYTKQQIVKKANQSVNVNNTFHSARSPEADPLDKDRDRDRAWSFSKRSRSSIQARYRSFTEAPSSISISIFVQRIGLCSNLLFSLHSFLPLSFLPHLPRRSGSTFALVIDFLRRRQNDFWTQVFLQQQEIDGKTHRHYGQK
jgi:hypothetical protein